MSKITLKTIPCIIDQAYFIMVGLQGSWLWEATYPDCQDEVWCTKFVKEYTQCQGWDDKGVQEHIDCSYEDIISYREVKFYDIIKDLHGEHKKIDTVYTSSNKAEKICRSLTKVGDSESRYYIKEA
jgi:hypothetical protein